MLKYKLFKSDSNKYGIIVIDKAHGDAIIIDEVNNISDNMDVVQSIVDECNKHNIDPIHLRDVIEDKLYLLYS